MSWFEIKQQGRAVWSETQVETAAGSWNVFVFGTVFAWHGNNAHSNTIAKGEAKTTHPLKPPRDHLSRGAIDARN